MKKSTSVTVTVVAAIGMAIACNSPDRASRVCVDQSNRVVQSDLCDRSYGAVPYFWYYHAAYARGPYPVSGTVVRAGGTVVMPRAAPVVRGGFGSTASGRAASS